MQAITPFLWFDSQAEEAARYYCSIFDDSEMGEISRYPENTPGPAGTVMTVQFVLKGQEFTALNGGPEFDFTPAVSLFVHCKDQEEVDRYWNGLMDGGASQSCGWVTDKFGVTWQIVPDRLGELLADPDPQRANRAMQAMLQMDKIEIKGLEDAANAA
jgi:predicted 3-demethylubiquinone-9 3-methyltransferase (glyoxalase superfamily)